MIPRILLIASILLVMFTVSPFASLQVRAQYGNGALVWVDYGILNQTNTVPLASLNGFLLAESINHAKNPIILHSEQPTVIVSGGGSFHVGQQVLIASNVWSGQDNKTINTVDVLLVQVLNNVSSTVQTVHIYNVPAAVGFTLTCMYTFSAGGEYHVIVRFNGPNGNLQDSTIIHVARQ